MYRHVSPYRHFRRVHWWGSPLTTHTLSHRRVEAVRTVEVKAVVVMEWREGSDGAEGGSTAQP